MMAFYEDRLKNRKSFGMSPYLNLSEIPLIPNPSPSGEGNQRRVDQHF